MTLDIKTPDSISAWWATEDDEFKMGYCRPADPEALEISPRHPYEAHYIKADLFLEDLSSIEEIIPEQMKEVTPESILGMLMAAQMVAVQQWREARGEKFDEERFDKVGQLMALLHRGSGLPPAITLSSCLIHLLALAKALDVDLIGHLPLAVDGYKSAAKRTEKIMKDM